MNELDYEYIWDLIHKEYKARGLKWPTETEAVLWAMTELGEVCEALLGKSPGWVRNNPADHDDYDFAEELGDVIRMCLVAGYAVGIDPLLAMVEKSKRKMGESG